MFPHPIAVAADIDDVAVVQQPVDEGRRHHLVPEDSAPFLEAFVGRQHCRGAFVAGIDELEEQHRPVPTDGEIADLIDDEERGIAQHAEAARELSRLLPTPCPRTKKGSEIYRDIPRYAGI